MALWRTLHEKCPYSEFFWSLFSCIRIEYGEIQSIFPHSVRMRENTEQKKSDYGHFPAVEELQKVMKSVV